MKLSGRNIERITLETDVNSQWLEDNDTKSPPVNVYGQPYSSADFDKAQQKKGKVPADRVGYFIARHFAVVAATMHAAFLKGGFERVNLAMRMALNGVASNVAGGVDKDSSWVAANAFENRIMPALLKMKQPKGGKIMPDISPIIVAIEEAFAEPKRRLSSSGSSSSRRRGK